MSLVVSINAWITEDKARELVAMADMDLDELREAAFNSDFEPVPLGITTSIGMDVEISRKQSANVLGLIPGSDPELSKEVVIYTAHHDHLGIGTPNEDGDTIYNGAMDNASGVLHRLWRSQRACRQCRKHQGARSSWLSSERRNRDCSVRSTTQTTRHSRRVVSQPT